ncbi:Hypothetical predicted protein [Cloeon dipterum]|uniref:Uncharacterized protein n=1 Tax=Cloeon dipterum TaxID=197152 RepID=A0A8S1CHJ2_9INSE|nr:Hypothetical predicted protein [Cloeon dipterum]
MAPRLALKRKLKALVHRRLHHLNSTFTIECKQEQIFPFQFWKKLFHEQLFAKQKTTMEVLVGVSAVFGAFKLIGKGFGKVREKIKKRKAEKQEGKPPPDPDHYSCTKTSTIRRIVINHPDGTQTITEEEVESYST